MKQDVLVGVFWRLASSYTFIVNSVRVRTRMYLCVDTVCVRANETSKRALSLGGSRAEAIVRTKSQGGASGASESAAGIGGCTSNGLGGHQQRRGTYGVDIGWCFDQVH